MIFSLARHNHHTESLNFCLLLRMSKNRKLKTHKTLRMAHTKQEIIIICEMLRTRFKVSWRYKYPWHLWARKVKRAHISIPSVLLEYTWQLVPVDTFYFIPPRFTDNPWAIHFAFFVWWNAIKKRSKVDGKFSNQFSWTKKKFFWDSSICRWHALWICLRQPSSSLLGNRTNLQSYCCHEEQ